MKKILILLLLFASFLPICCFSQARYYIREGGSSSDDNSEIIVAYFNSNKSNVCYTHSSIRYVKNNLNANANYYNEWGSKYVNMQQNNNLIGVAFPCRYYNDTNNAFIYIRNFPSNVIDFQTKQPMISPCLAFSHDFRQVRLLIDTNPPLYNEVSVNQLVKPLF